MAQEKELNLVEILRDCPKGTKLYSPLFGEVKLDKVEEEYKCYPISVITTRNGICNFAKNGKYYVSNVDAECLLFPSKDNRDWSTFKVNKQQEFKPFDKVIVWDYASNVWYPSIYSYFDGQCHHVVDSSCIKYCLPYKGNEHLVGCKFKEEHLK